MYTPKKKNKYDNIIMHNDIFAFSFRFFPFAAFYDFCMTQLTGCIAHKLPVFR